MPRGVVSNRGVWEHAEKQRKDDAVIPQEGRMEEKSEEEAGQGRPITHCTGTCYDVAARSTGHWAAETRGGGSRRWAGREDRATSFRDRPDVQRGGGGRRRGGRRRRRRRRATRPKGCSPAEGPRAEAAALRPAARSGAMPPIQADHLQGVDHGHGCESKKPLFGYGLIPRESHRRPENLF